MPQIGQRPHNPIIAPGPILLGHANNQFLNFSVDPWPARGSPFLRAIELAGDEPSVPCQDGVRQGGSRHLAECLANPVDGQSRQASLAPRPKASAAPSIGPSGSGFQQPDTHSAAAAPGPPSP